jgi:hypothetical protein
MDCINKLRISKVWPVKQGYYCTKPFPLSSPLLPENLGRKEGAMVCQGRVTLHVIVPLSSLGFTHVTQNTSICGFLVECFSVFLEMAPCHWTSARARQANHTLNSELRRYEHFRAVRTYQIISIVFAELPKICALGPFFKKKYTRAARKTPSLPNESDLRPVSIKGG